jgi:hypothetical protein
MILDRLPTFFADAMIGDEKPESAWSRHIRDRSVQCARAIGCSSLGYTLPATAAAGCRDGGNPERD